MAFEVEKKEEGRRIVLCIVDPREDGKEYKYLIKSVTEIDIIQSEKRARETSILGGEDSVYSSSLMYSVISRTVPLDHDKKILDLCEELDGVGFDGDSIINEVVRVATLDSATLISEGHEVRE